MPRQGRQAKADAMGSLSIIQWLVLIIPILVVCGIVVTARASQKRSGRYGTLDGVFGWLLALAIMQVLSVFRFAASLAGYYGEITEEMWAFAPGLLATELAVNLALLGLSLLTTWALFAKKPSFPGLFAVQVAAAVLTAPVWYLAVSIVMDVPVSELWSRREVGETIAVAMGGGLWCA